MPGSVQGPGMSAQSSSLLPEEACRPGRDGYRG
jgi:hypothetical protein